MDIKAECLYAGCKPNPNDLQAFLTLTDDVNAARFSGVDTLCSTLIATRAKSVSGDEFPSPLVTQGVTHSHKAAQRLRYFGETEEIQV